MQNKKIELIQWLSTIDDISIIEKIIQLRNKEKVDWWHKISDIEKDSIKKGIMDADEGKLNSQIQVKKIYERWL